MPLLSLVKSHKFHRVRSGEYSAREISGLQFFTKTYCSAREV
jgi:hypothetical protein